MTCSTTCSKLNLLRPVSLKVPSGTHLGGDRLGDEVVSIFVCLFLLAFVSPDDRQPRDPGQRPRQVPQPGHHPGPRVPQPQGRVLLRPGGGHRGLLPGGGGQRDSAGLQVRAVVGMAMTNLGLGEVPNLGLGRCQIWVWGDAKFGFGEVTNMGLGMGAVTIPLGGTVVIPDGGWWGAVTIPFGGQGNYGNTRWGLWQY